MAGLSRDEEAAMLYSKLSDAGAGAPAQNPGSPYDTALSPDEATAYPSWKARYAPNDSGADYDLRGAMHAGLMPDPQTGHWPDTFKKPNHETFSDESMYARGPDAARAGHWNGDTFIPPNEAQAFRDRVMGAQDAPLGAVTSPGVFTRPEQVTSPGGGFTRPAEPPKPTPMPGGGGAAAPTDRFGVKGAQQAQYRTLEEEKSLQGDLGIAKARRIEAVGGLNEQQAMRQQRDAEIQQQHDEEAHQKLQAFLDRNTQMADELATAKIDPGRLMRSADSGMQFQMAIGSMLGGFTMRANGGHNHYLERLDKVIDRDVRAQETNIDNKHKALTARQGIFGQMLAETGDRRLAGLQTRTALYEAAKMKIQADADRLGIPEVRAQAELSVNSIQQKIDTMKLEAAKQAQALFQQQANAAAAAQRAAEERAWTRQKDLFEMGHKTDELAFKREELGMNAGAAGAFPPGMSKEGRNKVATEQYEATRASEEFNSQVDALKEHPAIKDLGFGTVAAASFGQRVAPGSTKTVQDLHQINTQVLQAIGKVAKDADGKPNKVMIDKLEGRFEIHPSDTKEVALQKLEGARSVVNALAREQGAKDAPLPVAPPGPGVPFTPRKP